MTNSSTVTQSMAATLSPTPSSTPTPCKYFSTRFNSTDGPDACAIGVFAGGGALIVIVIILVCLGVCCCCCKQQRKQRSVKRTKPLVATQAASWFTNSLTKSFNKQSSNKQVSSKQNDYPELPTRDKESNKNTKSKTKIEEGSRGHVYQTLHLDEMDYESMYTRTVPKKQIKRGTIE